MCTSSVAPSRLSNTNAHFNASAENVRQSSRKCGVVFAVLLDPALKNGAEKSGGGVDSRLLEIVESADFQTKVAKRKAKGAPELGLSDTSLRSTLEHRLWVMFGGSVVTGMLVKAVLACGFLEDYLEVGVGAVAAWILADLATGVYHWGIDNYGDAATPVFGAQIDAFQGHHQRPWTITKREFANNVHAIARPAGIFLAPFLVLPSHAFGDSCLALFLGLVVMSQQIHAFAHMKKSQLPASVVALQDRGVLLPRKMHGAHHKPPYDVNYCIVSGLWNPLLNETAVLKRAERLIYSRWHVAPRAWSETSHEWLAQDTYFEDGTDFDPSQS